MHTEFCRIQVASKGNTSWVNIYYPASDRYHADGKQIFPSIVNLGRFYSDNPIDAWRDAMEYAREMEKELGLSAK